MADARSTFAAVLASLRDRRSARKHPLLRLLRDVQDNVDRICAGSVEVDVRTAITLQRVTAAFAAWAHDPSHAGLLQESTQPEGFDHNTALLQVASMLEASQLAPEFVPRSQSRTADLILRISASHWIDLDNKAPKALRHPEGRQVRWVDPRRTIASAIRRSRGQFYRDGILVISGEIWFGGIDAYMQAAERLLERALPDDASPAARAHHEQLLGIIFASTGYEELGRSFQSRSFFRWVSNPHYAGDIGLELSRDVDGPFSVSFPTRLKGTNQPDDTTSHTFDTRSEPARYKVLATNEVEVEGHIINQSCGVSSSRILVWQFPPGHRPDADVEFDVACETGFTSVAVLRDGSLLADPTVGSIDLRGVRFARA
jgi:hypothetical protein